MQNGSLKRLLFGSPFSDRAADGTDPAIEHLDCLLRDLIEMLREEHGTDCRAFRQAEREMVDVLNLSNGANGEFTDAAVACKRGLLMYAIWRNPEIAKRFESTDADLLADLQRRVLPLIGPVFLANLGQRPDAFISICSVMSEMWCAEDFTLPLSGLKDV